MRILLTNSVVTPQVIGGTERSIHLLARELSARGHHVDLLASTGRRAGTSNELSERTLEGISGTVYEAPLHGLVDLWPPGNPAPPLPVRLANHVVGVKSRRWGSLTARALERAQPDVVHTNNIVGTTGSVWEACGRAGVAVVHTARDYHLLCPRTTLLRSSGNECVSAPLPCRAYRLFKKPATARVDVLTAASRFALDRHLELGFFDDARHEVVFNACEPAVQPLPARPDPEPLRLAYLGQLDAHKGVGLILEVLTEWFETPDRPPLTIDFAGAGPMESEVRRFCGRWSRHTHFHGFIEGPELDTMLRNAHVLLAPSLWNEPFGRVVLDGFRYGLAVIGARRGGIPELIEDGRTGTLIEPAHEPLRLALERYAANPDLRHAHGAAGHAEVPRFSLREQIDRFEEIYRSLVENSARSSATSRA